MTDGPRFVLVSDPQRFLLVDRSPMTLGRTTEFGGEPLAPAVSREHLELIADTHGHRVRDLGSTNGTHLNGELLGSEPEPIVHGDELVLGGAVALRFEDLGSTPLGPRIGRLSGIWVNPDTDEVWCDAALIDPPLSARQLSLIKQLSDADGAIVERQSIIDNVWSDVAAEGVSPQAIDALVKRTRARLRSTGTSTVAIENLRGRGLRIVEN